jgi:CRP/FNR family transcriptional regulator
MNTTGNCLTCKAYSKSAFGCVSAQLVSKTLSAQSISINYKKGQDIFLEGTAAKGVFCVQSGKIKVYKECEQRNLITELAADGDLIGYCSIFNGGKYSHSAKCLEDTSVCFIPQTTFLSIVSSNTELLTELLRRSSRQNKRMSEYIMMLKCKNTARRIACALLQVGEKFGYDENKCLNVKITRKDISELSGTTTESAIRILNDFKKDKTIGFVNNRIRILDEEKLLQRKSKKD